jgi:endonuclease/exonuclease/phosphatase family metal-dependent hydrolase
MLYYEICNELPGIALPHRQAINTGTTERTEHSRLLESIAALRRIEVAAPPVPATAAHNPPRIAFWNAERGKYLQPSIQLLRSAGADVILLCEMDYGMARSGQLHTTRELATALHMGYAFAVEYVELDLGDKRERRWHAGATNRDGMHGAAILSPCALERPALIRLESTGDWFDGSRGERRVGGRIALAATLSIAGLRLVVVSIHLESHSDPHDRALQVDPLLAAIDQYAPDLPVIVGGDFNTKSAGRAEYKDHQGWTRLMTEDPQRLLNPVPYEPLFQRFAAHGYDWQSCNTPEPTQRSRPDGTPAPPFGRLDWFFTKGLNVTAAQTIAAVDAKGTAISDHDLLTITIG